MVAGKQANFIPPQTCLRIDNVLVLDPMAASPARKDTVAVIDGCFATPDALDRAVANGARLTLLGGRDRLLIPGLVNAHTHSPLNILKGTGDALSHPAFMWLNQADTIGRTPDEIRLSTMLGVIEHLLAGTTSVIDHFPEQGFGACDVDAVVSAYETSGMRALVALRIFDESYADIYPDGGLPAEIAAHDPLRPPPLDESLGLVAAAVAKHHRQRSGLISICPGPSNPMRCSDALLTGALAIAQTHDTAIHTHLLETEIQTTIAQQRYGTSMVQHLERLGLLGPRLSCAHTIWIDDDDIGRLAQHGTIVVHNPESNLKIGAGIAPVSRFLRAGVSVALGTDGASTNDNLDMHEVMRLAAMLQRPFEKDRQSWPTAMDAVRMATTAGGAAMGVAGLGSLTPGAPADFVLHDLTTASWTPINDAPTQLVFAASGATVSTVVVAGRVLVADRQIVAFDARPILDEARDLVRHLRARHAPLHGLAAKIARSV